MNKKGRSHRSAADGVVSLARCSGLKFSPNFFLRLRPIGLALRATPSARIKVASRYFLNRADTPPFQGGECRSILNSHQLRGEFLCAS
jgi:hypothetical protein